MADDTTPRDQIPRRQFLKGAGAAGTAAAAVLTPVAANEAAAQAQAHTPAAQAANHAPEVWLTLNATEAEFIKAAADTIIPADELSPSGSNCGVATFIDRQLAGAY